MPAGPPPLKRTAYLHFTAPTTAQECGPCCGAETRVYLGEERPLRSSVSFVHRIRKFEMDQNKEKQGTMTNQGQQSGGLGNPGQQAQNDKNNQGGQQGGGQQKPDQQTQKPGQGGQQGGQNSPGQQTQKPSQGGRSSRIIRAGEGPNPRSVQVQGGKAPSHGGVFSIVGAGGTVCSNVKGRSSAIGNPLTFFRASRPSSASSAVRRAACEGAGTE